MVGLNITRAIGLEQSDIDQLRGSGRKVAGAIAALLEFYLAKQREHAGITIAPMHDVCAVLPYAYPGLIDYAHARVEVELTGTHTRGMTLCGPRHWQQARSEHRHRMPAAATSSSGSLRRFCRIPEERHVDKLAAKDALKFSVLQRFRPVTEALAPSLPARSTSARDPDGLSISSVNAWTVVF